MAIAFALRAIPALFIGNVGYLPIFDTDSYYNLRQIDVMVHHFPQYNWFDPMTAFPGGKSIDWGPFFPFIAAVLCLSVGATTQSAIVSAAGWVLPLMAVFMVPIVYLLGRTLWNRNAGLVAAGLIAILSFQYFSLSTYGWVDHHIAEVFFSSIFFFLYISTISLSKDLHFDLKNKQTFLMPIVVSTVTGILYFFALLTSTTVILTLVVIAVYTIVQSIVSHLSHRSSSNLFIVNIMFLCTSAILFILFGLRTGGSSVTQYSIGIVYVHIALIIETLVLWGISAIFAGKIRPYLVSLAGVFVAGVIATQFISPFTILSRQALGLVFGSTNYTVGIVETLPLTPDTAFQNFNVALILMAGGLLILGYTAFKKRSPEAIFLLVWTVIMLILTIQFQRFQNYFTVNVVLLAGIGISEPFGWRKEQIAHYRAGIHSWFASREKIPVPQDSIQSKKTAQKSEKNKGPKRPDRNQKKIPDLLKDISIISVIILTIVLIGISVSQDIGYGINTPSHTISHDWIESLDWLSLHTPETGLDYYQPYDAHDFSYPAKSYGIMAVWDAGHWITFFSHRMPITNPFQDNLGGQKGTAAFFLQQNESQADAILQAFRGKYVITDSNMAIDTFTNLVPWQSGTTDISPYIKWFVVPDNKDKSHLTKVHLYENGYFQTQGVRLYNFDGSLTLPGTADYVQYVIRQVPAPGETAGDVNGYARVITRERPVDLALSHNDTPIVSEDAGLSLSSYADIFSNNPLQPIEKVPALTHYRLIHESGDNASVKTFPESDPITLPDTKQVKIFEFVNGAHIAGDGIIEVPVVTNTNRTFVYRQESENGEFVVPYSTTGSPYDVTTTGPYHITGTNRFINVTETDVVQGNRVSG